MARQYHCCASCIHYGVKKEQKKTITYCTRLGYETKPSYQFQCWQPKPQVQRLMKKEEQNNEV